MGIRIGLVDSGLAPELADRVHAQAAFLRGAEGRVERQPAEPDRIGHGSQVARIIAGAAPEARFANAQVFVRPRLVDAELVADAVDWCVGNGVRVINLSLGLTADRDALRAACKRALFAGITLVASCPARGEMPFPAAYPGVLAVCGDARCGEDEWSLVDGQWLLGAFPHATAGGGASFAAAAISGRAAAFYSCRPQAKHEDFLKHLRAGPAFVGRERKS